MSDFIDDEINRKAREAQQAPPEAPDASQDAPEAQQDASEAQQEAPEGQEEGAGALSEAQGRRLGGKSRGTDPLAREGGLGGLAPAYVRLADAKVPWQQLDRELTRLGQRNAPAGETPTERAAWAKVEAAFEQLTEARLGVTLLEADEADEQRDADKVVADALRAGKPMPKVKVSDWASEGRQRRAQVVIAGENLVAARTEYNRIAVEQAPRRLEAAVEALATAKARALEVVPGALTAFEQWRAAIEAVEAVAGAADPEVSRWTGSAGCTKATMDLLRAVNAAPGAMREALHSQHPVVSGSYAAGEHREMNPPLFARERIDLEGTEGEAVDLALTEIDERFRVTSFLRDYAIARAMVRPEVLAQIGG